MRARWILALAIILAVNAAASSTSVEPWGEKTRDLQSRIVLRSAPGKWAPLEVCVQLRNVSAHAVSLADMRVWLMLAQGPQHVYFTSAVQTSGQQQIAAGEEVDVRFDAASLAAYPYSRNFVLKNGIPVAPNGSAPESLGKLIDVLPIGTIRARALVSVSPPDPLLHMPTTTLIPSQSITFTLPEPPFDSLTVAQQREILGTLFRGDPACGKSGHDHALAQGATIVPELIQFLDDPQTSDSGREWIVATLIDLHDDRATDALLSLLRQGGKPARVIAYLGPRMKDARLTAAVDAVAHSSKDLALVSWATRGLALAGALHDGALLETMVLHTDAPGREEAADILATFPDSRAAPLLARLIGDEIPAVRIHAAKAAAAAGRHDTAIVTALQAMARRGDDKSRQAAATALNTLENE